MNEAMVSIIVPVYNSQKYIEDNILSIVSQSYGNFELIYIDDGSVDDSATIIKKYVNKDSRIRYLYQENQGAGAARNNGLKYATGEYVIFLDSDDFFHRDLLKTAVTMSMKNNLDICITGAYVFDQRFGKYYDCYNAFLKEYVPLQKVFSIAEKPDDAFFISGSFPWNKLYKHKFIKEERLHFQSLSSINDLFFVFSSYVKAKRIAVCPKRLVYYRMGDNDGLTINNDKKPNNIFLAYKALKNMLIELDLWGKYEKGLCKMFFWDLFTALHRMRNYDKFEYLFNQIKNIYIPDFKLFERGRDYYLDEYLYGQAMRIKECSAPEFIFWMFKDYQEEDNYTNALKNEMHFYFKSFLLKNKSHIIVYGLGNIGRDVVNQILDEKNVIISAIVDNYCEMGQYKGVDVIKGNFIARYKFDCILIAVWDVDTNQAIREELVEQGISKDIILDVREYVLTK